MANNTANDNGRDLFASFREVAWHGLGNVFQQEVTDFREMLTLGGLDSWNVRLIPMSFSEDGKTYYAATKANAVIRTGGDGTPVHMGTVGDRYGIVQNEDAFSVLQSLADGARWETAGALGETGSVVFGSIALDREIVLDPSGVADTVKTYGLVSTSHDGTGCLTFGCTPVRVVCENTLNAAMGNLSNTFKIRHTATAVERAEAAAEIWRREHAYFDAFETEAAALYATPVTDKQYANLVETVMGKAPAVNTKGALTKYEGKRDLFMQAWKGTPNAGIRGTAWGAWNALTEANQWGRGIQSDDRAAERFAMAGAGFDTATNKFRADTLALVKSRYGVKV